MPLNLPQPPEIDHQSNTFKFVHSFIAAAVQAQQLGLYPPYDVEDADTNIYQLSDSELDAAIGIKFMFHFNQHIFVKLMPIFHDSAKTLQPNEFAICFQKDQVPCEFSQVSDYKLLRNIITELDYETFWGNYTAAYWVNIINELNNPFIMDELTQLYDSKFEFSTFLKNKPTFQKTNAAKGNISLYYPLIINIMSSQNRDYYAITSGTKD